MGTYRLTSVERMFCDKAETGQHITAAVVKGPEGKKLLPVNSLRLMLTAGDAITIGKAADMTAEIRKGRCACGFKTIRTRRHDDSATSLNSLPDAS